MDIHGHPRYECSSCAHCVLIMTIHAILRQRLLNLHAFQIFPNHAAFDTLQALCRHQDLLKSEICRNHVKPLWSCLEMPMYLLTAAEWEQFVLESVRYSSKLQNQMDPKFRKIRNWWKVLERNPIVQHFRLPKLLGLNLAKLLRMHSMPCCHAAMPFIIGWASRHLQAASSADANHPPGQRRHKHQQTSYIYITRYHTISHVWPVYDLSMTCLWPVYDLSMTCLWPFYDAFICFICIYDPSIVWPSCSTAFLSRKMSKKRHGWCESFMITEP